MALSQLAARNQRQALGPLRLSSRAGRRRTVAAYPRYVSPAPVGRGGLARRGTSFDRRVQVLPLQPARGHADQVTGWRHQSPLGLRTGPSATQGRARPRPLREAFMKRPAPTRADVHDRYRLPPVPSAQASQKGGRRISGPPSKPNLPANWQTIIDRTTRPPDKLCPHYGSRTTGHS
jgi:hypothetical protein